MEVLQVPSELEPMTKLYKDLRPKRVLEIGCWDGGTMQVWLENAVSGATIVAVDLEHRNSDAYEDWRMPDTDLRLFTGSSYGEDGAAFIAANGPYDWILVDGDHSSHGVRADVRNCMAAANPGAIMLLHDITPGHGDPDCPCGDLFADLARDYKTWSYVDPAPASWTRGIGVVQL
jgi:predicted O-methyltransferase YrrM